jgi:hypothetical protein
MLYSCYVHQHRVNYESSIGNEAQKEGRGALCHALITMYLSSSISERRSSRRGDGAVLLTSLCIVINLIIQRGVAGGGVLCYVYITVYYHR